MESEKAKTQDRREAGPHRLVLEGQKLTVTGVSEILRFDETGVAVKVGGRVLTVRGEGLALKQLTPQDGRVEVRGAVGLMAYETALSPAGRLRRRFG